MDLEELIEVARGSRVADLVLQNARIVNVLSGEIYSGDIAIYKGRIVGIGTYEARNTIDLGGDLIAPGFTDGHVHTETAMVSIPEYARAVLPRGTTTIIIDPHEITNVLGMEGIRYVLATSENIPLNVYLMLSSCVPATDMETSGARLTSHEIALLMGEKRILGLGEVMNYPGVVTCEPHVMQKLRVMGSRPIDGHAPSLSGKELNAYVAAGIRSDHECTTREEAQEKLRLGMYIMIREGSTARNLHELLPLVTESNARQFFFVTDDRHPSDLVERGHIDSMIRNAIESGLNPLAAIQLATINPARYFGIKDLGAIAPSYRADIVTFPNFDDFQINRVFKDGDLVAENGRLVNDIIHAPTIAVRKSINVAWIEKEHFEIPAQSSKMLVIEVIPNQITTKKVIEKVRIVNGMAVADPESDLLKVAVIERHMASGNTGKGFVRGFGLKKGAIASSVAHDSHNIVVVGTNDDDMYEATVEIVKRQGGQVVAVDGKIVESLPLPIAGLISEHPLEEVCMMVARLRNTVRSLGSSLEDAFMTLSFLSLPVIPELRITDMGVVDVEEFKLVPLFV